MKPNTNQPIELTVMQGHIVLYCKGHYKYKDFFEGLKMIWAIRCGYDYELTSKETLSYIADEMYEILLETQTPEKMRYIMEQVHRNIEPFWASEFEKNLSPIQALIWQYRSHISNMQIKASFKDKNGYYELVKLPKPNKEVFNRILRGKGRYGDYDLIHKKDLI